MVLNKYRSVADPYLNAISERFISVHPNTLSAIAIICAIAGGFTIWAAGEYNDKLLLLAFLFIILNSLFDALDGYVARSTGLASKQGDLVDHVLDRYADAFIFGGITFSAYCHFGVGIIAMMGVFFTSYMGTQAMALGLDRNYGGILGRADRLGLLFVAMIAQMGWIAYSGDASVATLDIAGKPYPLTILEIFMVIVAIGGNFTALQRASAAWKDLKEVDDGPEEKASSKGSDGVTVEVESEGDPQTSEEEDDPPEGEEEDP